MAGGKSIRYVCSLHRLSMFLFDFPSLCDYKFGMLYGSVGMGGALSAGQLPYSVLIPFNHKYSIANVL